MAMLNRDMPLKTGTRDCVYFDDTLKGFGLRVRLDTKDKLRRAFIIQYRNSERQMRRMNVGDAAKITVEQARKKAEKLLAEVTLGNDPQDKRDAIRSSLTFSRAVEEYLKLKALEVRPSSLRHVVLYLQHPRYFGALHKMPVSKIVKTHVSSAINKITVDNGSSAAHQAHAHLSAFFVWAMTMGHANVNPCIGSACPDAGKPRERSLSKDELRSVWNACKDDDLGRIIKLLVLTGCRRTEIGELRWSEIDLEEGKIILPEAAAVNVDARTKNGHAHEVPLSPMALEIIRSIPRRIDRDFVFGFTGQGFRQWNLKAELEDGIAPWRLHDIRRTLTTEMAEHDIAEPHIVEAITNHRSGDKSGIRGVYNRAKYKQQMKTALNVWADHVASIVSGKARKVLPFTG